MSTETTGGTPTAAGSKGGSRYRCRGQGCSNSNWGTVGAQSGGTCHETFVRGFVPTVSSTTKLTRSGFISSTYRTIAWSLAVASNIGTAPEKAAWRSCSLIAATQGGSTRRSTSGWSTGNTKTGCIWKALPQGVPWSAIPISAAV